MTELKVKKRGAVSKNIEAFDRIKRMKKGSQYVIMNKDWKLSTIPGHYIIKKNTGVDVTVNSLVDGSGWVITRV